MATLVKAKERVLSAPEEIVNPAHTAFLVIDVQNDFVSSDGFLARFGTNMSFIQAAVPKINEFIKECRKHGVKVIYLKEIIQKDTVLPNFLSLFGDFDNIAVRENTWGAEFYPELVLPTEDEPVVIKPCYDGFEGTNLDVMLRSLDIRTCIFGGFASNVCVEATARHAFVKGYYTVLLSDASGAGTMEEHNACMNVFRVFYGPVLETKETIEMWNKKQEI